MNDVTFASIRADLDQAVRRALSVAAGDEQREEALAAFEREDGEALRQLFDGEAPLALVAFDTPGIQRYVFKTERPGDRQGGSNFVADFTRSPSDAGGADDKQRTPSLYGLLDALRIGQEAVVFAGAGSGLVLVAAGEAPRVAEGVESALRDFTDGDLRTAAAWLAVWPRDLGGHSPAPGRGRRQLTARLAPPSPPRRTSRYAQALAAVYAQLDHRRGELAVLATDIAGEELAQAGKGGLCQSCGERPGTIQRLRGDIVCKLCQTRGEAAGRGKKEHEQVSTTHDLFAEDDDRPRLALIYADGSNFGAAFAQLGSPAQHRALSLAVDEAFAAAVKAGLERCGGPDHQKPIHGGDDLVLLLSARYVFDFITVFVREVESFLSLSRNPLLRDAFGSAEKHLRRSIDHFGVGVGIAIADETFPDRLLLRYAKELLRSAKNLIHESHAGASNRDSKGEPDRSAVDFLVLRSGNPLNGSIESLRKHHFRRPASEQALDEPILHWTCRPYGFSGFEAFIKRTKSLAETVPRTQLYAVHRAVHAGYQESQSFFRYQNARDLRADATSGWAAYRLSQDTELVHVDRLLWRKRSDGAVETDFVDMMEIHDLFTPKQETRA